MPNFALSPELSIPVARPTREVGVWIESFLQVAVTEVPEALRPAFLKQVFRWLLQMEGSERLSEEEIRLRKERFYALLPSDLQSFFPWEPPSELPPPPPPALHYPQVHTPFRQYGVLTLTWVEVLAEKPEAEKQLLGSRLVRHLYHLLRQQGVPVEEASLLENLQQLSGDRLRLYPQGLSESSPSESAERRPRKGKPFRYRR